MIVLVINFSNSGGVNLTHIIVIAIGDYYRFAFFGLVTKL